MPDWKTASDYDFAGSLKGEGWAWEFLRRNPEYAKDYKSVRGIYQQATKELGPYESNRAAWAKSDLVVVNDPLTKHGDSLGEWNGRVWDKNISPAWIYLEQHRAGIWGLREVMVDPDTDTPPKFRFPYNHPCYLTGSNAPKYCIEAPFPDQKKPNHNSLIAIGFDLKLPLKPQLEKAEDILRTQFQLRQPKKTRRRGSPSHWVTYLRLLDACAAKSADNQKDSESAWRSEILSKLWAIPSQSISDPDLHQKLSKWMRSANQMMAANYITCLTVEIPEKLPQLVNIDM